jgi:micrococcal nuclease
MKTLFKRGVHVVTTATIAIVMTLVLFFTSPSHAANETFHENIIVYSIYSVYDGDTFRANIDNWPDIIGKAVSVRVHGADTPELRGAECPEEKALGLKAKEFTKQMVMNGTRIELKNIKRDKYFRLLAEVWVDGKSLTTELIANGLAYAYDGGTKQSWCNK